MRRFAVKLILSYKQKHEPRSKYFIFDICDMIKLNQSFVSNIDFKI